MTAALPKLTFTALAKFMNSSSHAQMCAVLKAQRYPAQGPIMSYRRVEHAAVGHLVDGTPLPLGGGLDPYEIEALQAFAAVRAAGILPNAAYRRPSPNQPKLELHGVLVSCQPTVVYRLPSGQLGAVKLYLNKEPRLGAVGKKMATLLWYHLHGLNPSYEKSAVRVIDVRAMAVYEAGAHVQLIERLGPTCLVVKALWGAVESEAVLAGAR